jgi:predicted Zn-dependent peptidase
MKTRSAVASSLGAASVLVAAISLGPSVAIAAPPPKIEIDVHREKLPNGLRVVLAPDRTSPTVAVDIVYDVGGRNEERGHSGFAHLFEHMMFQGSKNVPRGEHFRLVTSHGGSLNGTTSSDRTNYYELLPQSELALALWLEGDRLKSLDISQSNFENQRAVVKEEYRMRVENAPYVPADIHLQELVFKGYWPYEHSAIGTMKDLDAAQLDWVRAFHDAYYAPNHAVLSVSGDFDAAEALALVTKYFGDAKPTDAPKYEPGPMPEQTSPRDEVMEDAHATLPAVFEGWAIPPNREPDHYALEIAGMLLTDGESSRLHRSLVRERSVAIEVQAGTNDFRGPDWFELTCKLAGGAKLPDVEKLLDAEVARLGTTLPTAAEMEKARTRLAASYVLGLQSNFARAQKLAEMELYYGDANLLKTELAKYLAVTGEEVRRAAAKYLTKARRSRIEVKPPAAARSPGASPAAVKP